MIVYPAHIPGTDSVQKRRVVPDLIEVLKEVQVLKTLTNFASPNTGFCL
jgi:hypothetical protein